MQIKLEMNYKMQMRNIKSFYWRNDKKYWTKYKQ